MNTEQIRDELLAQARESARKDGRDVEVTSVAFDLACARVAELEGALSAWQSFDDLLRSRWGRRDDEPAPAFADRLVHEQAAELGRLRSLERNVRVAARDSSALDEVDARILAALEEFDRAPAQAWPQDGQCVAELTYLAELLATAQSEGRASNGTTVIKMLLRLSQHPSPVVREGVVYGMSGHVQHEPIAARLRQMADVDPSEGVRTAAREEMSESCGHRPADREGGER